MKAIETEYKGYKFRSRLEARWAVFLDACGVRWEYEPEGYDLGDGIYYLPDFLLHNVYLKSYDEGSGCDIYVEVKGQMTDKDARKIATFAGGYYPCENGGTGCIPYPILVVGNIPKGETFNDIFDSILDVAEDYLPPYGIAYYNFTTIMYDDYAAFPGVDTEGHFVLFGSDYMDDTTDFDATTNAYRLARQARFEHGEKTLISKHRDKKEVYDPF